MTVLFALMLMAVAVWRRRGKTTPRVLARPPVDHAVREEHIAIKRAADAMAALEAKDHWRLARVLCSGPLKPGGGRDLLDRAIHREDIGAMGMLRDAVDAHGIEPGQADTAATLRWVPLVSAACHGQRDVVSQLLWMGADPARAEPPLFAGWPATTALAGAVVANQDDVVNYLLDHGPYRPEMLWPGVPGSADRRGEIAEAAYIAELNSQPMHASRLRGHLAEAERDALRREALWREPETSGVSTERIARRRI
jgi:hypothetical protein